MTWHNSIGEVVNYEYVKAVEHLRDFFRQFDTLDDTTRRDVERLLPEIVKLAERRIEKIREEPDEDLCPKCGRSGEVCYEDPCEDEEEEEDEEDY